MHVDPFWPKPSLRAIREADTLRGQRWDVYFLSWIIDPIEHLEPPADPYPVRRLPFPVPPLGTSVIKRGLAYNRATSMLRQAIVDAKPELIIAHDLLVLRAAVAARSVLECPLIYDCHENWPPLVAEKSRVESILTAIQERRLTRKVDHLLIPCEPVARKFRRWGVPTTVIVNARPMKEVSLADRMASRRTLGYQATDFVAGFAGALAEGRGLEVLLAAVQILTRDVKALIVGGPEPYAEALRRKVDQAGLTSRVRIESYRPFPELSSYYGAMDVGLILADPRPNHLTALPNKLFDYMAHGIPVIVPDYPAMADVVRAAVAGWTVREITPEAVARAIEAARTSREATVRGRNGREAYMEKYSWDRQEAAFLTIVSCVLSSGR